MLSESKSEPKIIDLNITVGNVSPEGVAYYLVSVNNSTEKWVVQKRYSNFEQLHNSLSAKFYKSPLPAFPPKKIKLLTSHTSPSFLEERRVLLLNYLTHLIKEERFIFSNILINFLSSDKIESEPTFRKFPCDDENLLASLPDDQEVTDIKIPSTRTMSDHILFQVDVINAKKRSTFSKWTILRRFNQVFEMHNAVKASLSLEDQEKMPECPRREPKIITNHMDEDFVEMRRALIESYLQKMLQIPIIARNQAFLSFLGAI